MKTTRYFGFLILLLSGLFFVQCTSEPIVGPPGMDGKDGIDGINGQNGQDGLDGTASCVACHSNSHRAPIYASYEASRHAEGLAVGYAGGRGSCSRCHSNEGYINYITGMPAVNIDNPTAISCKTCHDKHETFDFENDGQNFALRSVDPVTLIIDDTIVLDFEGTSNNCAECHQPRRTLEGNFWNYDEETGIFTVGNHFGPHYSNQATMYEGIGGAFIAGSTAYPGTGSTTHYSGSSCVDCHMAADAGDITKGQHSWHTNENSCNSCHSNGAPHMDDLDTDMETLAALLQEAGVLDDTLHAIRDAETSLTVGKALWNFIYVHDDQSHGVHNPAYTRALIKNSIEALQ